MAKIGVLPTKTSIELREPDGDAGTLPAATESAAGVMTAQHVKMLSEVWASYRGGSQPIVIEAEAPPVDTSQFVTRAEAAHLMSEVQRRIPPPVPLNVVSAPSAVDQQVAALREAVSKMQREVQSSSALDDVMAHIERLTHDQQAIVNELNDLRQITAAILATDVITSVRIA